LTWFTELNIWIAVAIIIGSCVAFSVLFVWLIEKFTKKNNTQYHPYACYHCGYDMLGSLAARVKTCSECGSDTGFGVNDYLIAKSIILGKKIPESISIYHIYTLVKRNDSKYFAYAKSIYSDSPESANSAAKRFYGEDSISISRNSFNFSKDAHIIPPFLTFTSPILGLAAKTFDGKISWASTDD
tara:strand:- start:23 stop:577 length:555 start_codon:yes stop_codon:yes gene_type:complete